MKALKSPLTEYMPYRVPILKAVKRTTFSHFCAGENFKSTSEEESALRVGLVKYGTGKWRTILKDLEFAACLAARSNVDLKDKWRNLMSSLTPTGQGSKTPRQKPLAPVPISSAAR